MSLIKRKIGANYFILENEENVLILPETICLQRGYYNTKRNIVLNDIEIENIPLGISIYCLKNKIKMLITNFEEIKLIENFSLKDKTLNIIIGKINEIKEFYKSI